MLTKLAFLFQHKRCHGFPIAKLHVTLIPKIVLSFCNVCAIKYFYKQKKQSRLVFGPAPRREGCIRLQCCVGCIRLECCVLVLGPAPRRAAPGGMYQVAVLCCVCSQTLLFHSSVSGATGLSYYIYYMYNIHATKYLLFNYFSRGGSVRHQTYTSSLMYVM